MSYDQPGHIRSRPNDKETSSSFSKKEEKLLAGMTNTFSLPPQIPLVDKSHCRNKLVSSGNKFENNIWLGQELATLALKYVHQIADKTKILDFGLCTLRLYRIFEGRRQVHFG